MIDNLFAQSSMYTSTPLASPKKIISEAPPASSISSSTEFFTIIDTDVNKVVNIDSDDVPPLELIEHYKIICSALKAIPHKTKLNEFMVPRSYGRHSHWNVAGDPEKTRVIHNYIHFSVRLMILIPNQYTVALKGMERFIS